MAQAVATARRSNLDVEFDAVVAHYRRLLAEPAVMPWAGCRWEPVRIGPVWQTTSGGRWLLPEASIGWAQLGWIGTRLQLRRGVPFRLTLEQARWLLWWGALDERGQFLHRDGILQRLKGWGKDPIGAILAMVEAFGPARFVEWDGDEPVATDVPEAWVQLAATSLEQTKNTTRMFPRLVPDATKDELGLRIGKEVIYGLGDERMIQAVTSSPSTLEGARATFVLKNETQHWLANNDGHEMAAVIERNSTKSEGGLARTLAITNAFEPGMDSQAERDREAWELSASGGSLTTGIMYDSLEAPPLAPLSAAEAPEVVRAIRGDSAWLDVDRIVQSILDTRNPPSRSRRFWYNQIQAAEDAWADPQHWDSLAAPQVDVGPDDPIVVVFDGAKTDDATGIVGVRLSDGHAITLGMWQRPPAERGVGWLAPRAEIDQAVERVFERHNVVGFWADPSHALDDVTEERYWDSLLDGWHHRYKARLRPELWAQPRKHAVLWDMANHQRQAEFTAAAERALADMIDAARAVTSGQPAPLTHDGDARLRRHVHNARRYPNRWGVSIWKGHRESPKKIDLAVCWILARHLRRQAMLAPDAKKGKQAGRVYAFGHR
jgi:hypothetical protein